MTLMEYLNKITNDGTRAILPKGVVSQWSETTGNDGQTSNGITVVCYRSESITEAKREEQLVQKITSLVLNTQKDKAAISRFWKHAQHAVPPIFRKGEYSYRETLEFVQSMALAISCQLSDIVLTERHWKGAETTLKVLQTRMDAWNSSIKVESDEDSRVTTVTFERF